MEVDILLALTSLGGVALALSILSLRGVLRLDSRVSELTRVVKALLSSATSLSKLRGASRASSRPRRRYIVFEVIPGGFSREDVERAIEEAAKRVLGVVGVGNMGLKLVYYSEERSRGALRVRNEWKYAALAVLGFVRRIGDARVTLVPLSVTGSIKKAKKIIGVKP